MKRIAIVPLLFLLVSWVPVVTSNSKKKIINRESKTDQIPATGFVTCGCAGQVGLWEKGVFGQRINVDKEVPEGSVCLQTSVKEVKDGDDIAINVRTKYKDMIPKNTTFKGIQIMHIYDSNGGRCPKVYVFYSE